MTSFDRRKDERVSIESKVEYVLNFTDDEEFHGDIVDISAFGLCFNTTVELREGQEIIFKNIFPSGHQTATVVWIEKTDNNYYRVGLEFK